MFYHHYKTSESYGKCRKSYVDHLKGRSKLTCLIHGPGHLSDECKVLGEFGTKYAKYRTTKDHSQDYATMKRFGKQQDNNDIIQRVVDDIILQYNNKLSVKYETHDNTDEKVDEDELYELDK